MKKEEISMEVTRSYRYLIMPDAAQKQKIRDIITRQGEKTHCFSDGMIT